MTRFTPKLGHDPAYMKDPDPRSEPVEFVMTDADRSLAAVGTCHLEDYRRRQNERNQEASNFVHGLAVKRLSPDDLSEDERRSFGL